MSFTVDLSRLVETAKGKTDLVVKKVMLETFSKVIYKSPVRSGRFRANWIIGYSSPDRTTSLNTDKSGTGTIGQIASEITGAKLDGKSIYLTNSLVYSLSLENGNSKQSPQGMVKITLMEISAKYGR